MSQDDTAIELRGKFLRFISVGAIGTFAHYLTLVLLVDRVGLAPVAASSAGFLVGAIVNYWLNYHLTFRSRRAHRTTAPIFFAAAFGGFWLNAGIMSLFGVYLGLHYLFAQLLATGATLLWNFSVSNFVTFREGSRVP